MLAAVLSKRIARFSQLFYKPTVLDYPINRNDSELQNNKHLMDSVNNGFSKILHSVTTQTNQKVLDKLKK